MLRAFRDKYGNKYRDKANTRFSLAFQLPFAKVNRGNPFLTDYTLLVDMIEVESMLCSGASPFLKPDGAIAQIWGKDVIHIDPRGLAGGNVADGSRSEGASTGRTVEDSIRAQFTEGVKRKNQSPSNKNPSFGLTRPPGGALRFIYIDAEAIKELDKDFRIEKTEVTGVIRTECDGKWEVDLVNEIQNKKLTFSTEFKNPHPRALLGKSTTSVNAVNLASYMTDLLEASGPDRIFLQGMAPFTQTFLKKRDEFKSLGVERLYRSKADVENFFDGTGGKVAIVYKQASIYLSLKYPGDSKVTKVSLQTLDGKKDALRSLVGTSKTNLTLWFEGLEFKASLRGNFIELSDYCTVATMCKIWGWAYEVKKDRIEQSSQSKGLKEKKFKTLEQEYRKLVPINSTMDIALKLGPQQSTKGNPFLELWDENGLEVKGRKNGNSYRYYLPETTRYKKIGTLKQTKFRLSTLFPGSTATETIRAYLARDQTTGAVTLSVKLIGGEKMIVPSNEMAAGMEKYLEVAGSIHEEIQRQVREREAKAEKGKKRARGD